MAEVIKKYPPLFDGKKAFAITYPEGYNKQADRILTAPSGAKKRMNLHQTDKSAPDYPYFEMNLTHQEVRGYLSSGFELTEIDHVTDIKEEVNDPAVPLGVPTEVPDEEE